MKYPEITCIDWAVKWLSLISTRSEQVSKICSIVKRSSHPMHIGGSSPFNKKEWVMKEWPMCNRAITVSSFLFVRGQTACCYLRPHSYYVCMQLLFKPGCPVSPLTMYPTIYHWGRRLFSDRIHFSAPGFSAWHSSNQGIPHLDDHLPVVNKLKCQSQVWTKTKRE